MGALQSTSQSETAHKTRSSKGTAETACNCTFSWLRVYFINLTDAMTSLQEDYESSLW